MQDWPPVLAMQQDNQPMPQQKGESVAETDRTNTKQKEATMTFGDRLREWFSLNKSAVMCAAIAVVIAVLITTPVIGRLAPTRGDYNTDMAGINARLSTMNSSVATLAGNVANIVALGPLATSSELATVSNKVTSHTLDISVLTGRVTAVETGMTEIIASPPEGYLTGNFSTNYTLHARCSTAANYTANVNLVYLTPIAVGNTTQEDALQTFYGSINWTGVVPNYICTTTYSGNTSSWGINRVWWNIGIFEMAANNETLVDIIFGGLNSTYEPDFAYVEVYSALTK
jgi:hypothetical protein